MTKSYPIACTADFICNNDVFFGSNDTVRVFVAKLTVAESTPGIERTSFSTLLAHTAQLISRTGTVIFSIKL